jgi:hypothetical protein
VSSRPPAHQRDNESRRKYKWLAPDGKSEGEPHKCNSQYDFAVIEYIDGDLAEREFLGKFPP